MAVQLEGSIKRWIGLSSDTKPYLGLQADGTTTLTAQDIPAGSSLLETDTGRIYRWDGTFWSVHIPADAQAEYFQAILFELASIKEAIIEGLA